MTDWIKRETRSEALARAAELEHEAKILERDAPNRYRQSIANRRALAKQLRESI